MYVLRGWQFVRFAQCYSSRTRDMEYHYYQRRED
jgi:hypothetical protein